MEQEEQQATLPLRDLIWNLLGDDNNGLDKCAITPTTAIVLSNLLKDSLKWKVEFEDREGKPLKYPLLWRYSEWFNDHTTYERRKVYQEKERVANWIRHKNEDNLVRVLRKAGLDEKYAKQISYTCIKNGNLELLKVLGLERLVTDEKEL